MTEIKLPSYIPLYESRKKFCRKVRDIEKEMQRLKDQGKWKDVARLSYTLRNAWWGYKRYLQKK
tara:strand:+ start:393 stop:584 length:192 start_codon:yes stop_codon:yes gene_type:complete